MTYTTLLPARMGRLELRNRIVFPAMVTNCCSTRGEVTDRLVAYHQERAKGGAGLLITEATYISPDGKSFPHQLGIDDDGLLPGLRRLVESVHAAGARIAVHLCHAGRQTSRAVTGLPLLSPSVTRFGNDETCAMRQEDIDRVLRDYAGAALRAQKAGFDAVELHAGNGYLPQQFLSPFTNARQDGYGGSLENRVRFTVEAIRAVRAAVGPDFPIILRLGVAEPVSGGLTLEDGVAAARILAREDIDAFDVTAGMREGGMWVTPPLALPPGHAYRKGGSRTAGHPGLQARHRHRQDHVRFPGRQLHRGRKGRFRGHGARPAGRSRTAAQDIAEQGGRHPSLHRLQRRLHRPPVPRARHLLCRQSPCGQ